MQPTVEFSKDDKDKLATTSTCLLKLFSSKLKRYFLHCPFSDIMDLDNSLNFFYNIASFLFSRLQFLGKLIGLHK